MRKYLLLTIFSFLVTAGFSQFVTNTLAGGNGDTTSGYLDGSNSSALFNAPAGVAVDSNFNVYVADSYNNRIRLITVAGTTSTFAGDTLGFRDGLGTTALFNQPLGVCTDKLGNIYVADTYNNAIRKITPAGMVTTIGGKGLDSAGYRNGFDTIALFNMPTGVTVDTSENIYVADYGNNVVRKIASNGIVSTLAGRDTVGYIDGADTSAEFNGLAGIALDDSGFVYVTEFVNNDVRKIRNGYVSTLAGGGFTIITADSVGTTLVYKDSIVRSTNPGYNNTVVGTDSSYFDSPTGLVIDKSGNIFISDEYNNVIREISKGKVYTFAGNTQPALLNGVADSAEFYQPVGIAQDKNGNFYVGDNGNNVIRTIAGQPTSIAPIVAKKLNMNVYPIPCNQNTLIASAPSGAAQLTDITGRVVWSEEHFKAPYTLSTEEIPAGVYFIRVSNTTQSAVTKIVIQH